MGNADYRRYLARVIDVYDADTFRADVDFGFGIWAHKMTFRVYGINAPEMKGAEKAQGTVARDHVRGLLLGRDIWIRTYQAEREKFGRWLADAELSTDPLVLLSEDLVSRKLAIRRQY